MCWEPNRNQTLANLQLREWHDSSTSIMLRPLLLPVHIAKPIESATSSIHDATAFTIAHPVVTDLTVCWECPTSPLATCESQPQIWHRIEIDLYLDTSPQRAWLYVALKDEEQLTADDIVLMDISVGERPLKSSSGQMWESRPSGIWVLRSKFNGNINQAVTEVDVLFGKDAVDPRPHWALMHFPLHLSAQPMVPEARLSILHGRSKLIPDPPATLRVKEDGTFKIVQISDTHMVTGTGVCRDAIDQYGKNLPESEADPLTVDFIKEMLRAEKPDLVVFTGDQLHHDILDSKSALFKLVAPVIEQSIAFAAVFGNHDSEGERALSRSAQMSILQSLPFSLCLPGPELVDGVGNYCLQILAPAPSLHPVATLYLLDSHGEIQSKPTEYDYIKQSQIEWFKQTAQAHRIVREEDGDDDNDARFYLSLAFQHIPLPEFGNRYLRICSGSRREPTEGPRFNSHFYDALAEEGIVALGCGHDHVNDFCALLPQQTKKDGSKIPYAGPWLCYGGGSGFGGYCSYGRNRFHRRMRVWKLLTRSGALETWTRHEFDDNSFVKLRLAENGVVVDQPGDEDEGSRCTVC